MVDVDERKAMEEHKRQIDQYEEDKRQKILKKKLDTEEIKQVRFLVFSLIFRPLTSR